MRVLFIYPNLFSLYAWSPGIMILSAYLKERGHETELIHVNNEFGMPMDLEKIVAKARAFKPDVVGITAITFEYPVADKIAAAMKEAFPGIPVLLGGTHATIRPDDLASSNFDGFCVGEGEKPLIDFLSRLGNGEPVHETPSFHYKLNGQVVKNPLNPFIKDLDELPFYDWSMLDIDHILKARDGWLNVMFSRGCPFVCTFCINQALKAIKGFASFNRTKSVDKTMEELKYLASRYKVKVFNFDDDLLMLNRQWMRDFMKRYKEEIFEPYGVQYKANTRCDLLTEDFAKELSASGCREIQFGVEAGNEELRNGMLKKALKTEKIIEAFDLCHRYKVNAFAFMMLGIPGETRETVREAFQLLARIQPDVLRVSFLTPFFGTPIYDYCKQHDLFKEGSEKGESYFLESGLKFEHITTDELSRAMFLYAWNINAELGHEAYRQAIGKYAFANAAEFQRRWPEILEANQALIKTVPAGKSYYDFFYDHHYFLKRKVCGREEEKMAAESMSEDVLMAVE